MFNLKTIIIVIVVVALAFVGYGFLISGKNQGSASGVTKQAVTNTGASSQSNTPALDGPGKEFVTQLLAIQNIKFNLQLFSDPVFQGLQDWSREILPQESGRPNPFAPLDTDISQPAGVTSFSGSIESSSAQVTASSTETVRVPAKNTGSTRPISSTKTR